jgi:predicted alpha/beta hydrolase family esterase
MAPQANQGRDHAGIITLPGFTGSGEAHSQTLWERSDPRFIRFQPSSWDDPALEDWVQALETAIRATQIPPVLVADSLACLLVAHWTAQSRTPIAGAFLVAVPDPEASTFPSEAASFHSVPTAPIPFPTLVIASADDLCQPRLHAEARKRVAGFPYCGGRARPHKQRERAGRLAAGTCASGGVLRWTAPRPVRTSVRMKPRAPRREPLDHGCGRPAVHDAKRWCRSGERQPLVSPRRLSSVSTDRRRGGASGPSRKSDNCGSAGGQRHDCWKRTTVIEQSAHINA